MIIYVEELIADQIDIVIEKNIIILKIETK